MSLIEVKHVIKTYQMGDEKFHALNDVSFSIKKGEFVAIMGTSGSGKSTCMNMLGTLDKPTTGEYYLDGIHSSYPDFVMKDKNGKIHIFEVKSVNKSSSQNINEEEYEDFSKETEI